MEWILFLTVTALLFVFLTTPAPKPVKPPSSWDEIRDKLDALDRQIAITKGRVESLRNRRRDRFDQMG